MLNPVQNSFSDRWNQFIDPKWIELLDETSFLKSCREGTVSIAALHTFAAQQFFYARHFTRYLCALLSNIENEQDRRELTENLVDETGLGSASGTPHSVIYRRMLEKMGVDVGNYGVGAETQALIETMLQSCRNPNAAVGLGALCLGAEAIVPHIYGQIVHGFQSRGYSPESLDFFYIHIAGDDAHAITMREIIERELTSPRQILALRCAASRAIAARARFFNAIPGGQNAIV